MIDAHVHLWLEQRGTVNGLPVYNLGGGRSMFGSEVRQILSGIEGNSLIREGKGDLIQRIDLNDSLALSIRIGIGADVDEDLLTHHLQRHLQVFCHSGDLGYGFIQDRQLVNIRGEMKLTVITVFQRIAGQCL